MTQSPEPGDPVVESVETHDDTGLELARSIARSLAQPGAKPGTTRGGKKSTRKNTDTGPRSTGSTYPGAHPDDRDPQALDSTIGRLVAEQGWASEIRVHGVFTQWARIVGVEVAQHCRPETFDADAGKLIVRTDSTAWATNLRLLAPTVVKRLADELGDGVVMIVEVLGPAAPSWKKGPRSVRDGRGPRDTYG
ncbi:MAG: DUF721 domain-containing protein [Nocardioidaceae bacterium]|nr:MAG: DUF721 domain-containing protein [Nocardioidaceae bacterium]